MPRLKDLPLINGGYTYDAELITRLRLLDPAIVIERLESSDLATRFQALDLGRRTGTAAVRSGRAAGAGSARLRGGAARLRAGQSVVALPGRPRGGVPGPAASHQGSRRPDLGRVLAALDSPGRDVRPQLVLNYKSELVRRIGVSATDLIGLAVEALYGQSLLLGYHPIRPADAALLNRSFLGLLDRAVPREA